MKVRAGFGASDEGDADGQDADQPRSADPSFFRNMSAYENLLFFGRVYGLSIADIRKKSR